MTAKALTLLILLFCTISIHVHGRGLSPLEFGLKEANNAIERFWVLHRTHTTAIAQNTNISYHGIDTIRIEIPINAVTIPLAENTDFAKSVIIVTNRSQDFCLFSMCNETVPIEISKQILDTSDFTHIKELCKGYYILNVEDETPWVAHRTGYNSGAVRRDILLIKNGKAINKCIIPYNDSISIPKCSYVNVSKKNKLISGATIIRSNNSTYKTFCFKFENQNQLELRNIYIRTPKSDLYGDIAINFICCTNIHCNNITIDGTYSQNNKYGYGIGMNNVWNSRFTNLTAHANWGIFGTNNVNLCTLTNCDINRFDIHCYGRDVYCKNIIFRNLYNQFSSFYGDLTFDNCQFINFVPILIEDSYSAYTTFNITFKNCNITADSRRPYLIDMRSGVITKSPVRKELSRLNWPNLFIDNMVVNFSDKMSSWNLYYTSNRNNPIVYGLTDISIHNLKVRNSIKNTINIVNTGIESNYPSNIIITNSPTMVKNISYKIK